MSEGKPLTVLLVDDHAVVREGYRRLLERHGDIIVVGEAADASTAHALFCGLDPQIVVMDITLPAPAASRRPVECWHTSPTPGS